MFEVAGLEGSQVEQLCALVEVDRVVGWHVCVLLLGYYFVICYFVINWLISWRSGWWLITTAK